MLKFFFKVCRNQRMSLEIIEYLVELGFSVFEGWHLHLRKKRKTKAPMRKPFFYAIKNKKINLPILKFFFEKMKLKPSQSDFKDYTLNKGKYDIEILNFFLKENELKLEIPLYYNVVENSNLNGEIIEIFLKNGLDPNYYNIDFDDEDDEEDYDYQEDICESSTPFEIVCRNFCYRDTIHKMIEYGADLNLKIEGKTVFERIFQDIGEDYYESIPIFLSILSTNLFSPYALGRSILYFKAKDKEIHSLLVEYRDGFIWNKENHQNFPPFFRSQTESFLKCIYFLIKNKRFQQTFPKPILFIIIKHFSIFPDPQINKKVK